MKARRIELSRNLVGIFCPGCKKEHAVPYGTGKGWHWNEDTEKPTISPSILARFTLYGPDKQHFLEYEGEMPCEATEAICHSFVTDGRIEFLSDSTHELAGQTVDLPDWELP